MNSARAAAVSFEDFVAQFIRVENPLSGRVEPMTLYPRQQDFVRRVFGDRDARGLRRYRRGVFSMPKKSGKTGLGAASGLYMLCFDAFEASREVYSIATDLDQARLIWKAAEKMVQRSPMFQSWVQNGTLRVLRDEIVLEDREVSGVFRPLATDTKGLHGISPSCLLVDETWTQQDYALLEACALPPTRRCPLELHFTYAGLQGQQQPGIPLWDLFLAGQNQTDPSLYFVYESGRAANFFVPWISDDYLTKQERALPLNRFRRLHYNEWGASDTPFLTAAEIARAFPGSLRRVSSDRSQAWIMSIDYGRTHDMSVLCVARQRDDGVVQVGELLVFKGTRDNPVPLELIEQETLALSRRFRIDTILCDQWQTYGSIERLRKVGTRIDPVSFGPAYLNQITTNFLSLMRSGRFQCFPHPDFEAQLASVIVKETFYGCRIDSGVGAGVRSHDDMVIAAAMAAQLAVERQLRRGPLVAFCLPGEGLNGPADRSSLTLQAMRQAKSAQLEKELDESRRARAQRIADGTQEFWYPS